MLAMGRLGLEIRKNKVCSIRLPFKRLQALCLPTALILIYREAILRLKEDSMAARFGHEGMEGLLSHLG